MVTHKAVEALFSGLLNLRCFKFKLSDVGKLSHQNLLNYYSIIPSIIASIAASLIIFAGVDKSLADPVFKSMLDVLIMSFGSILFSYWVTLRDSHDYILEEKGLNLRDEISNQPITNISNRDERYYKETSDHHIAIHVSGCKKLSSKKRGSSSKNKESPMKNVVNY